MSGAPRAGGVERSSCRWHNASDREGDGVAQSQVETLVEPALVLGSQGPPDKDTDAAQDRDATRPGFSCHRRLDGHRGVDGADRGGEHAEDAVALRRLDIASARRRGIERDRVVPVEQVAIRRAEGPHQARRAFEIGERERHS